MKTLTFIFAFFLMLGFANAQSMSGDINTGGTVQVIADKYIGAGDSCHFLGRYRIRDNKGRIAIDSLAIVIARQDSLDGHLKVAPVYWDKTYPYASGVVTPASDTASVSAVGAAVLLLGNGAGATVYPHFVINAALSGYLNYEAIDIYFTVNSGSGMASDGKKMNARVAPYYKDRD